jgi:hypothetical protein
MKNRSAFVFLSGLALAVLVAPAQAQSLQDNQHYHAFKSWAKDTQYPDPLPNMFKFCIQSYDKMIASGVSPATRVPEETMEGFRRTDPPIVWSGTVQEIKEKWCEAGLKKKTDEVGKRHAPYHAALKNDKLRLVVDSTHGHVKSYAMPGGQYTDDAKKLAAASVWFLDLGAPSNERQNCPSGGKRKIVRRYTFDAQHKLVSTTSKEYCGDPPASAYR